MNLLDAELLEFGFRKEATEPAKSEPESYQLLLAKMKEIKADSDSKRYGLKHKKLRALMLKAPKDWVIDSPGEHHPGITHKGTGFKFHTNRRSIPWEVPIQEKAAAPDYVQALATTPAPSSLGIDSLKGYFQNYIQRFKSIGRDREVRQDILDGGKPDYYVRKLLRPSLASKNPVDRVISKLADDQTQNITAGAGYGGLAGAAGSAAVRSARAGLGRIGPSVLDLGAMTFQSPTAAPVIHQLLGAGPEAERLMGYLKSPLWAKYMLLGGHLSGVSAEMQQQARRLVFGLDPLFKSIPSRFGDVLPHAHRSEALDDQFVQRLAAGNSMGHTNISLADQPADAPWGGRVHNFAGSPTGGRVATFSLDEMMNSDWMDNPMAAVRLRPTAPVDQVKGLAAAQPIFNVQGVSEFTPPKYDRSVFIDAALREAAPELSSGGKSMLHPPLTRLLTWLGAGKGWAADQARSMAKDYAGAIHKTIIQPMNIATRRVKDPAMLEEISKSLTHGCRGHVCSTAAADVLNAANPSLLGQASRSVTPFDYVRKAGPGKSFEVLGLRLPNSFLVDNDGAWQTGKLLRSHLEKFTPAAIRAPLVAGLGATSLWAGGKAMSALSAPKSVDPRLSGMFAPKA